MKDALRTTIRPVEPVSWGGRATEAIRDAILRGDLTPGQRLVEQDLAGLLGISKTPVREALKILSHSGLIEMHINRGATVASVDSRMVTEVYRVRLLLEPAAVGEAVPLHDSSTLGKAQTALEEAASVAADGDRAALSLANRYFHRQLYQPCKNRLLQSVLDDLQDRIALISVAGWGQRTTYHEEAREHQEILAAAQRGDAPAAERLLRGHIERFLAALLSELRSAQEKEGHS